MTRKEILDFLRKAGAKGGKAGTGKAKSRGDTAYYRKLAKKATAARKAKKGGKAKPRRRA